MASTLASLNILVGADIGGFKKGFAKAQSITDKVGKSIASIGAVTAKAAAPFAALGAVAVGASVKVGNMADELLDLEQMTGLTTDQLQEFRRVATVAGVGPDTIAEAAQRLTTRLRAAGTDTLLFVDNMKALGVQSKDSSGELRSMSELLPEIIAKLQGTESITKRNALASQIFGRSYQSLAPVLGLTTDQFEEARQSAHDLGLVLGRDSLNAANDFRIKWQTLRDALGGAAAQIGIELIPVMTKLANFVTTGLLPAIQDLGDLFNTTASQARKFREEIEGIDEAGRQLRATQIGLELAAARLQLEKAEVALKDFSGGLSKIPLQLRGVASFAPNLRRDVEEAEDAVKRLELQLRVLREPDSAEPIIPPGTTETIQATATAIATQLAPALDNIVPKLAAMNSALAQVPVLARDVSAFFQDAADKGRTFGEQLFDLGVVKFAALTDAVADFATGSKDAFKDFVDSAVRDLTRLIARFLAFKALTALFPGSGFATAVGQSFGFLAKGGAAFPGRPYVVGEQGPELFVPKVAGDVIANDALRGSALGPSREEIGAALLAVPPPRFHSPEVAATDDYWRRLIGAAMLDWEQRGGRLRGA